MANTSRTHGQWWEATEDLSEVSIDGIRTVVTGALRAAGASVNAAEFLLSSMLAKATQGDPIRGFGLLPNILRAAADGTASLDPEVRLVQESGATALVDGGSAANGGVVCQRAMEVAIRKARENGVSWVSCTSFHWTLGPLLKMATEQELIAIVLNSSIPTVAPVGGVEPVLGNAPTGIGIPAGDHLPINVDLSITNSSSTPIAMAALKPGSSIPDGFILDVDGQPSTDPRDYLDDDEVVLGFPYQMRGSLQPLGGQLSGHKGYALVFAINVLATGLSDTDAPWVMKENTAARLGCQMIVVDPLRFVSQERFIERVDEFITKARSVRKREGAHDVVYPGERSQQLQRERQALGSAMIPSSDLERMRGLAAEQGLDVSILAP